MRISVRYIKKDWGSGKHTWRMAKPTDWSPVTAIRKANHKLSKKLIFAGSSIKSY